MPVSFSSLPGIDPDGKIQFDGQKQDQFRCPRRARPRCADPAAPADPDLGPRRAPAARLIAATLAGADRRPRRLLRRGCRGLPAAVPIRVVTKAGKGIAMTPARQILFIQGGGAGAHDEWDAKLAESLRRELGGGHEVRYPRMPDEGDPGYARWSAAIRRELADLDDGAVVAGHSAGAAILINALAEQPPQRGLGAIVLIAAPFVGEGGWPSDEFELTGELGARLPSGVPVYVFHGLQDETVPPSHAGLYARAIPQAQVHRLPGRDHQLNNDLSEVAEAIRLSGPGPGTHTQSRYHFHSSG